MTTDTVPTVLAWHSNPKLKAEVVERMRQHRAEDSIVQGVYQSIDPDVASGYRGCAIGCTLPELPYGEKFVYDVESAGHGWWKRVETDYGIPVKVAQLIDDVFEAQDCFEDAADFAVQVIENIPVGADLTRIHDAWWDAQMYDGGAGAQARWLTNALAGAPIPAGTPAGA